MSLEVDPLPDESERTAAGRQFHCGFAETLSQTTQLNHPHISDPQNSEIINIYCLKPLNFGVIYFKAIVNN